MEIFSKSPKIQIKHLKTPVLKDLSTGVKYFQEMKTIPIVPSYLRFDPALSRWVPSFVYVELPQLTRHARNTKTQSGSRIKECSVKTNLENVHIRIALLIFIF